MIIRTFLPFVFLSIISFVLVSCEKEETLDLVSTDSSNSSNVAFEELKVGDIMIYSFLKGESCYFPNESCEMTYTGDTLELMVVDIIDSKFKIQEQITTGSAIFNSDVNYIGGEIEAIPESLWEIREDSVLIIPLESGNTNVKSHLLKLFNFSLQEITENEVEFKGWQTTLPSSSEPINANFFIKEGKLQGITYPHLNGVLRNTAMSFDQDGSTHIYSRENGFVRVSRVSAWGGHGKGWDRIN